MILDERVIPVARGLDATTAPPLASALQDGGINSIEVTMEGESGIAAIEALAATRMIVGAGTVTTFQQARYAINASAQFLVSPHTDGEIIGFSIEEGVPLIPGGFTPNDFQRAWLHPVPAVKVFPAAIGNPSLIKALLGPYPDLLLIPTGGIDGSNAAAYIEAGAVAVGVGGWLTSATDPEEVSERAAQLRRQVV